MRPLTDTTPKPLLEIGGKPLIVRQVEALVYAGFDEIVINVAWLADKMQEALGDGSRWGARIAWSVEALPGLETAGGIAHALPLLKPGAVLVTSADIKTSFDYRELIPRLEMIDENGKKAAQLPEARPLAHLVMVPNPPYHPEGDFALGEDGLLTLGETLPRLTFGNIGIYHTALFTRMDPDKREKLTPHYRKWIARRRVSGALFSGEWKNVGTPEDLVQQNDS